MSELLVVGFPNEFRADEVMLTLSKLKKTDVLDLEDSAVIVRDQKGEIHIKHKNHLTALAGLMGSFWGLLVGSLLLNPLGAIAGTAIGASAGAITGKMIQLDVKESFIRELTQYMKPGTSALFLLVNQVDTRKVQDALGVRDAKLLVTPLPKTTLQKIKEKVTERPLAGANR